MAIIAARAKLTLPNGKVHTSTSSGLSVTPTPEYTLADFVIRVESSNVGSSTIDTRTHYELTDAVRLPVGKYNSIYPILRKDINKTQTDAGLSLAAGQFNDTWVNERSVQSIALNEVVGTWRFSSPTSLNIPHILTSQEPYGESNIGLVFKHKVIGDITCTVSKLVTSAIPLTMVFDPNLYTGFSLVEGDVVVFENAAGEKTAPFTATFIFTGGLADIRGWIPGHPGSLIPGSFGLGGGIYYTIHVYTADYSDVRYWGGEGMVRLVKLPHNKFCSRLVSTAAAGINSAFRHPNQVSLIGDPSNNQFIIPALMTDCSAMFENCTNLLILSKIVTLGKPTNLSKMFYNCTLLDNVTKPKTSGYATTPIVFNEMDVSGVTDFSYMFYNCAAADPDVIDWIPSSAADMRYFIYSSSGAGANFNRNLSGWCVSKILSEPVGFSTNQPLTPANKPVWGTCPVKLDPAYAVGYYNAPSGGSLVTRSSSSSDKYLRFKLKTIPAGTVLVLRAGSHATPGADPSTEFKVIQANGAVDSSNGAPTVVYSDFGTKDITLTFPNAVANPVEFVIAVSMYNQIYKADRFGTSCVNYVLKDGVTVVSAPISLTFA